MTSALWIFAALLPQAQVPTVQVDFWNNDPDILYDNNCYNYSTNRVTNNFAQPGEASGQIYQSLTCQDVIAAAKADLGLEETAFFAYNTKQDDTLLALVVSPNVDYHWYRRGDDGMWSHKMGGTPAVDFDNKGQPISDPQTADRGEYLDFCGYFKVRNYFNGLNQQDAGYVRIGDMTDLPDLSNLSTPHALKSKITLLNFSGRRNPELSLQKAQANTRYSHLFYSIQDHLNELDLSAWQSAPTASQTQVLEFSKPGSGTVMISDSEGIYYWPGTRLLIKGNQALAYIPGQAKPRMVQLKQSYPFEKLLK